jgi:beta-RFAP synthase
MNTRVKVEAPARLHLGFMDMHGGLGRMFGSLGVAINEISTVLCIERTQSFLHDGPSSKRSMKYARLLLDKYGLHDQPISILTKNVIPEHAGLGSGTQMALATGRAIATLLKLPITNRDIAELLDRGTRSGIGLGAFENGGFLVDGGRGQDGNVPFITSRQSFPRHWRILLLINEREKGFHDQDELNAFNKLPEFPENLSQELCRIVLMQIMPALASENFVDFSSGIGILQSAVGDHFSKIQGGRFANANINMVLRYAKQQGYMGIGQSSWGPTGFILTESELSAHALQKDISKKFPDADITYQVVAGRNNGHTIEVAPTTAGRDRQEEHTLEKR